MEKAIDSGTRLDEALMRLGYSVTEGSTASVFKIATPDGSDAGELGFSDCWAYLREKYREFFEASPPVWDEERHGPFRLEFTGFCPVFGDGIFNDRHECHEE